MDKGARNVEILKQNEGSPVPVEEQVAIIYLGTKGKITKVPVNKVIEFQEEYLMFLRQKHSNVLATIKTGKLTKEVIATLEKVAADLTAKY